MEATGMDPGVSSLAPEKGHPLGLTTGEEAQASRKLFFFFYSFSPENRMNESSIFREPKLIKVYMQ